MAKAELVLGRGPRYETKTIQVDGGMPSKVILELTVDEARAIQMFVGAVNGNTPIHKYTTEVYYALNELPLGKRNYMDYEFDGRSYYFRSGNVDLVEIIDGKPIDAK